MKKLKNSLFILLIIIFSNYSLPQKNYFSPNFIIPFIKEKIQETKKIFSYPQKLLQSEYVQKNKSKLLIGAGIFAFSGYFLYRYFKSKKKRKINPDEKIKENNNYNTTELVLKYPETETNENNNSIQKIINLANLLF
jgi:hypothetical protein